MVFVTSIEHAVAVVDKLQERFPSRLELFWAREMIAAVYGYESWAHFLNAPRFPLSPFDGELDYTAMKKRWDEQAATLEAFGLSHKAALGFIRDVRPTGRTRDHQTAMNALMWNSGSEVLPD
jgi:hypothetical protein